MQPLSSCYNVCLSDMNEPTEYCRVKKMVSLSGMVICTLESVEKFCYLGDMRQLLHADGGVDSAVVARVRYAQ